VARMPVQSFESGLVTGGRQEIAALGNEMPKSL
jgi:hypothetical protein